MTSFRSGPDARGLFGRFGGQFVAETLMPLINQLAAEYEKAKQQKLDDTQKISLNIHKLLFDRVHQKVFWGELVRERRRRYYFAKLRGLML